MFDGQIAGSIPASLGAQPWAERASRVALAATRANACCEAGVGPHGSCDPPCLSVARRAGSDGVATMADASAAFTLAYDSGGNLTGIDAYYGVAINLSLYLGFPT